MRKIRALMKNSINMSLEKSAAKIALGQSKIGGKPHLPKDFVWPYYEGETFDEILANRPLSFIAQINLEEVANYDLEHMLPKKGFLFFFYELESMRWGYDPKDKGSARVYYIDCAKEELVETMLPNDLGKDFIVPEFGLSFRADKSLPDYRDFEELVRTFMSWGRYDKKLEKLGIILPDNPETQFKLLGYADIIQQSMLSECEEVSRGLYCGTPVDRDKRLMKDIRKNASDWVLLAQFGYISDECMFGDSGCIYYYIKKQDLAECKFENVHLCLQCY